MISHVLPASSADVKSLPELGNGAIAHPGETRWVIPHHPNQAIMPCCTANVASWARELAFSLRSSEETWDFTVFGDK